MSAALDLRALRLKDRTRSLQASVGGVEASGAITGKGKSHHGRFQSAADNDFASILDVVKLEAVAPRDGSWPPVTQLMCELAGGVFLPLPDTDASDSALATGLVRVVKEFGELCAATGDGLADGTLVIEELLRIKREGLEVQAVLAMLLRDVDAQIEAVPTSIAAVRRAEGRP